jgi:hypothetical protein
MKIARPAARASTGLLQGKPLKHRARPAARASTGWKQEDLLKHRARPVPRTRSRLLRVVLKPTAGVMWAIRGLTEVRAQRAWQESTRHQPDRPIARTAGQARILQQ